MRYQIRHRVTYQYAYPVAFAPHLVQLRPRCDVTQQLLNFSIEIYPQPKLISGNVDLDGNSVLKASFAEDQVQELTVEARSRVETYRSNPFDYLLEPWATHLPVDYPTSLSNRLQPYLRGQLNLETGTTDPVVMQLAQELWQETEGSITAFLTALSQRIYKECTYVFRESGAAFPAGLTWTNRAGSCRDYAVLFIETCRAIGLSARFVSGYQEGDLERSDHHLHAWTEVYLPGAGWRGFDPTQGLAVADRHVALVAMPSYSNTAPVSGSLRHTGAVPCQMAYHITIASI